MTDWPAATLTFQVYEVTSWAETRVSMTCKKGAAEGQLLGSRYRELLGGGVDLLTLEVVPPSRTRR